MRRLIDSRIGTFLLALALVAVLTSVAMACPNCKDAMEKQDPTHGGLVKGYFYSILFMMCTPYVVFGTFCGVMYYRVRRARLGKKPPLAGAAAVNSTSETAAQAPVARRAEQRESRQSVEV